MCIQCALVVFTLEFGLNQMRTASEVDWNRIGQLRTVNMPPRTATSSTFTFRPPYTLYSLSKIQTMMAYSAGTLLTTLCRCCQNKSPLTKWPHVVYQNSRSTLSTTSNKIRQIVGRTLVCVLIHLECWLDKARVEIVTWAAMGVARQQQFSYNSVLKFWQCM